MQQQIAPVAQLSAGVLQPVTPVNVSTPTEEHGASTVHLLLSCSTLMNATFGPR
jgi:hypothetical protein